MEKFIQQISTHWESVVQTIAFDTALLHDTELILRLVLQIVLLIASAFFSKAC